MTMQLKLVDAHSTQTPRFTERLTYPGHDIPYGYSIGGAFAGPRVLVAGETDLVRATFARLSKLPTLPWMRGQLLIVDLEAADTDTASRATDDIWKTPFDEMIMLPFASRESSFKQGVDDFYWSVLRLCADLGMISGRGVRMVGKGHTVRNLSAPQAVQAISV